MYGDSAVGGVVQIPDVTNYLHDFLEPTFHDSEYYETLEPSNALTILGMFGGAVIGIAGIAFAYQLWIRSPDRPAAIRARLAGVHSFFVHKWYFDELIDTVSLCGPPDVVRERLAVFRDAGVGTLMLAPMAWTRDARLEQLRLVAELNS